MQDISAQTIWNDAKNLLKQRMNGQGFSMWVEPLQVLDMDSDTLVLGCSNPFSQKWLQDRYGALLSESVSQAAQDNVSVTLEITGQAAKAQPLNQTAMPPVARQANLPNLPPRKGSGRLLCKDYTFDRFVVGDCNGFAYSAALSLANRKKGTKPPLFLYSKTGMGKTHLSQAVGHHILAHHPADRVMYATCEEFTGEMVHAICNNTLSQFKDKFRNNCDVLLLEGVEFISGKDRTQKELAFTLDSLLESEKRLIFTSSLPPNRIPKLHESVASRINSSVVGEMETPDFRTRVKILKKRANGNAVPGEILEFLASELPDNVRQLITGLDGLLSRSSLMCQDLDLDLAREVVQNIARQQKCLTLDTISHMVCRLYRITMEDLRGRSRRQGVVIPRQIAMYLGRKHTDHSLAAIGKAFRRQHATALHAIGKVEKHLRNKDVVATQVNILEEKILAKDFQTVH